MRPPSNARGELYAALALLGLIGLFSGTSNFTGDAADAAVVEPQNLSQPAAPTWEPPQANPALTAVAEHQQIDAELADLRNKVQNGDPGQVRGLYVQNALTLEVVQQPAEDPIFVSRTPGTATQYRAPAKYGTISLLAHNTSSGALFYGVPLESVATVIYGDGALRSYRVESIRRFKTVRPNDPYSDFIDLDRGGLRLTSAEIFRQIYTHPDKLVLQTCIAAESDPSWGIRFAIAGRVQPTDPR